MRPEPGADSANLSVKTGGEDRQTPKSGRLPFVLGLRDRGTTSGKSESAEKRAEFVEGSN